MHFENVRDWEGTADAFTQELRRKIDTLGLPIEAPNVRTVRSWRSKHLFSQAKGKNFGFRQILEGLASALFLKKGWTLKAIAEVLPSLDDLAIEQQIIAEATNIEATASVELETPSLLQGSQERQKSNLAENAVILLAQGILLQYHSIINGREIVRQNDKIPHPLHSAMCMLGRLYVEEGKVDRAACVHDVLERARHPLNSDSWGLATFQKQDFPFGKVALVESELRVPTQDCSAIAKISGSFGEDNVIEHQLHGSLRNATEKLGRRRKERAYSVLRELLGRRSLISDRELLEKLTDEQLTPLQETVIDFFDPVPDVWLIDGFANRCGNCGTLMRPHPDKKRFPDGFCPIRQCNSKFSPKVSERLNPETERLLIAKPQILTYWTGPAIDEIAIFDKAKSYGLNAELYPDSDRCDVSINDRALGIDAKSYTSPVSLALKLNQGIGGLIDYRRRIIAISDELVDNNSGYLSDLRSSLDKKGDPATLEIMSVSSVISLLKEM
jgi:hypothetical protein